MERNPRKKSVQQDVQKICEVGVMKQFVKKNATGKKIRLVIRKRKPLQEGMNATEMIEEDLLNVDGEMMIRDVEMKDHSL